MFPLASARDRQLGTAPPGPAACCRRSRTPSPRPAMFMAAGLIAQALGHDRIADLAGVGRALPMTCSRSGSAGALADGPAAERRLRRQVAAAVGGGRRRASGGGRSVIVAGGLLAGGYVFRVLVPRAGGAARRRSSCGRRPAAPRGGRRSRSPLLAVAARLRSRCGRSDVLTPAARPSRWRCDERPACCSSPPWALPLALLAACLVGRCARACRVLLSLAPLPGLAARALARRAAAVRRSTPVRLQLDARARPSGRDPAAGVASLLWTPRGALRARPTCATSRSRDASPSGGC